jgi:hypothetical protein
MNSVLFLEIFSLLLFYFLKTLLCLLNCLSKVRELALLALLVLPLRRLGERALRKVGLLGRVIVVGVGICHL